MRLVNKLKDFFYIGRPAPQPPPVVPPTAAARLIEYTASLVLHTDLIEPQLVRIKSANTLSPVERDREYIKIYFELEKFIVEHEPLVVKRKYTKEELRKDIKEKLGAQGVGFDLLLAGDMEQATKLCEIMSESILNQTTTMLGQAVSQRFMDRAGVAEFRTAEFRNPEQAISSFQKLLSDLYLAISDTIGKEKAKSIFEMDYRKVEEECGFIPYTIEILKILPVGILEEEKIRTLSRLELEEKVRERTKGLEESKAYVDNIIKSMIDTLIVVDPDGKIKTINKATSDLLDYKEDELIAKPVATIFAEEEEEEEEEFKGTKMKRLIEEGSIRDYDMTYKTKSGEKIPVSFSGSVMKDKEGELVGIVGIARDMREIKRLMQKEKELASAAAAAEAEKKRAEELETAYQKLKKSQKASLNIMADMERRRKELEKAYKELEKSQDASLNIMERSDRRRKELEAAIKELRDTQAMLIQSAKLSALGQLGAGVAHELNSPLAGVLSLVRTYIKRKDPASKEYEHLKDIQEACQHMSEIIEALSTFTRRSTGEKIELNCNELIESTLKFTDYELKKRDIKIEKYYSDDLPLVKGEKNQLQQVVVNMITNARDAISGKGIFRITTRAKKNNKGRFVEMEFSDNGCGMSNETLQRIFDPFFTTKRPGGGIGLGLSICYTIVKNHNGGINVRSKHGEGSTFTVILPAL